MDIIKKYFPEITDLQLEKFAHLNDLYIEWNAKINVVSRKDIEELPTRHILHSLGIAKVIQFPAHAHVLDVGTGGGLPGLPLAILFPEVRFHLIDSIGKKIHVVQSIAEELHLHNVTAQQIRAEQVPERFDYIVSRAVARLAEFYQWIQFSFKKTDMANPGLYYLKGGDLTEEIAESGLVTELFDLKNYYEEDFFDTKKVVYVPSIGKQH